MVAFLAALQLMALVYVIAASASIRNGALPVWAQGSHTLRKASMTARRKAGH
jgi:hypothetical protein